MKPINVFMPLPAYKIGIDIEGDYKIHDCQHDITFYISQICVEGVIKALTELYNETQISKK